MRARMPKILRRQLRAFKRRFPGMYRKYSVFRQMYRRQRIILPYRITHAVRALIPSHKGRSYLFYPERPTIYSVPYKICMLNGDSITTNPNAEADAAIWWQNTTFRRPNPTVQQLLTTGPVVNASLTDISKRHVDRIAQEVLGYGSLVDPVTWIGPCVSKSDENFRHDGEVLQCPLAQDEVSPNRVYQRLISNYIDSDMVRDIRLPIVGNALPMVYLKDRPAGIRFSNSNARVRLAETRQVFTSEEINQINIFCKRIGMDYGELDILRDSDDGRMYIVDANSTPSGPPNHLPRREAWRALRMMSAAFSRSLPRRAPSAQKVSEGVWNGLSGQSDPHQADPGEIDPGLFG